jgi:hypothetical protein
MLKWFQRKRPKDGLSLRPAAERVRFRRLKMLEIEPLPERRDPAAPAAGAQASDTGNRDPAKNNPVPSSSTSATTPHAAS